MTKNNKSASMIRRRRNKQTSEFISKVRKSQTPRTTDLDIHGDTKEESFFHKQLLGSSVLARIMSSDQTIFLGLVVIRLVNALLIQTSFVPDEFWQSMEVAHNMVFDYGYLTWEWKAGIRSYAYPLLLATLYKLLSLLGLDYRLLLIRGPRLLQGVVAAVGDMYLYRLSGRLAGREVARWTLLCQLVSWFTSYCCTRTLSNGLEATLVTAALFYFPWPGYSQHRGGTRRYVTLAALSVVVRPTAAVLWVLLAAWHLQRCKGTALWSALKLYLTTGLTVLGVSTVIDRVWYGRWILVHLNFLHFNVVSGGSGFYGRHPWHWYLTQGLPVTLGPHLLPFLLGACSARHRVLLWLLLWQVFVLSLLAHKEFRFLLPVLPLAMHYCGLYFHSASRPPPALSALPSNPPAEESISGGMCGSEREGRVEPDMDVGVLQRREVHDDSWNRTDLQDTDFTPTVDSDIHHNPVSTSDQEETEGWPSSTAPLTGEGEGEDLSSCPPPEGQPKLKEQQIKGEQQEWGQRGHKVRCLVLLLMLTNLPPLLYFSLIHQRGTMDVMNFLHQAVLRGGEEGSVDILFLMPCHSTPFYSHLHANVSLTFLTCEPNLHHVENYTDEAERFYQDPELWLREQYPEQSKPLPTHLVYFDVLTANISQFLQQGGYVPCAQFFHTHFPEGRVGSRVLVSCR